MADQDKKFIDQRVKVIECDIIGHDLLKELYVDFKFIILNTSVYTVAIDEDSVKGDIFFNARLLSKRNKIIENPARYCEHAESKHFILRQWFDRDEIADILNSSDDGDEFRFSSLKITVKGGSDEIGVYPKNLEVIGLSLSSQRLRELYQKLDLSILSASFEGFYPGGRLGDRGLRISINISFINPRPVHLMIQNFKLVTKILDTDHVTYAKEGEIRQGELLDWDTAAVVIQGQPIMNINATRGSFITLGPKEPRQGWLQFDIADVGFDEPDKLLATLIAITANGEEHSKKCTIIYKKN